MGLGVIVEKWSTETTHAELSKLIHKLGSPFFFFFLWVILEAAEIAKYKEPNYILFYQEVRRDKQTLSKTNIENALTFHLF